MANSFHGTYPTAYVPRNANIALLFCKNLSPALLESFIQLTSVGPLRSRAAHGRTASIGAQQY
jgi:hypothetical protein